MYLVHSTMYIVNIQIKSTKSINFEQKYFQWRTWWGS